MDRKLIYTIGLPYSGYADWASEEAANNKYIILDRTLNETNIIIALKLSDVILTGYHLNPFDVEKIKALKYKALLDGINLTIEVKDFKHINIDICLKQTKNEVEVNIIKDLYSKYIKSTHIKQLTNANFVELPPAAVFDLDGTLAILGNRNPYNYLEAINDTVNLAIVTTLELVAATCKIIIITARDYKQDNNTTQNWLETHNITFDELYMKNQHYISDEPDHLYKLQIYNNYIKNKYNLIGIYEDNDNVVKIFRDLGLQVYQVNYGNY